MQGVGPGRLWLCDVVCTGSGLDQSAPVSAASGRFMALHREVQRRQRNGCLMVCTVGDSCLQNECKACDPNVQSSYEPWTKHTACDLILTHTRPSTQQLNDFTLEAPVVTPIVLLRAPLRPHRYAWDATSPVGVVATPKPSDALPPKIKVRDPRASM